MLMRSPARFYFDPLPIGGFDFVMIDCPWPWRNYTAALNPRQPEAKYRTMPLDQIARLPVADLLRPGGAAFVWYTWPLVYEAPAIVANAWGLDPATGGAWVKTTRSGKKRMGTGFIFRSVCEPFLIATKGKPRGLRGRGVRNLIETIEAADGALYGVAREHSRKPDEAYALAERLTPQWRRADLFACETRVGWVAWGDQATKYNGGR